MSRLRRILLYCGGPVILGLLIVLVAGRFTDRVLAVELHFRPMLDGAALECGRPVALDETATGARREAVTLIAFRMLLAEPRVVRADGKVFDLALEQDGHWQSGRTAMLDSQDGGTPCGTAVAEARRVVRGTAPMGNYNGLLFRLPAASDAFAASDATLPAAFAAGRQRMASDDTVHVAIVRVATLDESGQPLAGTEEHLTIRLDVACVPRQDAAACRSPGRNVAVSAFEAERHGIGVELGGMLRQALRERFPAPYAGEMLPAFRPRMRRVER